MDIASRGRAEQAGRPDRESVGQAVGEALNRYLEARLAHAHSAESLATADAVLAARVALVAVLQESGWTPPARVVAGRELDEALLHVPWREAG